jgi:hypothetical protein
MADEPETNDPAPEPEPEPKPEPPPEPDWKAEARKWEKRAKENSDAAARLKELEDAQKTEQERLSENLTAAEKRAQEAELKAARLEVAAEKGLPQTSVKFLTGTTPEELAESAEELLALLAPSDPADNGRRPKERLKPGSTGTPEPTEDPKAIADEILGSNY